MDLADLPDQCAFCSQKQGAAQLCICYGVDKDGKEHKSALCKECIRIFLLEMATTEPEEFEKLVAEARLEAE
jgi:hypothetical protein